MTKNSDDLPDDAYHKRALDELNKVPLEHPKWKISGLVRAQHKEIPDDVSLARRAFTGTQLMERWDMTSSHTFGNMISHFRLPFHVSTDAYWWRCPPDCLQEQNDLSAVFFRLPDVTFVEKMHDYLCGYTSRYWISKDEFLCRHDLTVSQLESLVNNEHIPAYRFVRNTGVQLARPVRLTDSHLFWRNDIWKLEDQEVAKDAKERLFSIKSNRRDELRCVDLAQEWAEDDQTLRPGQVIERLKQQTPWAQHKDKTLRDWLKPVKLNRDKGRPATNLHP